MKTLLVVGGLHLLCSLIWTCSGEQSVYVRCSPSMFLVRIKSTAFGNDIPVTPNEVFLGGDCPVTTVYQGFYEFLYGTNECNIRVQVLGDECLLFQSEVIFMSQLSELEASIPVACRVPRYPKGIKIIKENDTNTQRMAPTRPGITNLYTGETVNRMFKSNKLNVQLNSLACPFSTSSCDHPMIVPQLCYLKLA